MFGASRLARRPNRPAPGAGVELADVAAAGLATAPGGAADSVRCRGQAADFEAESTAEGLAAVERCASSARRSSFWGRAHRVTPVCSATQAHIRRVSAPDAAGPGQEVGRPLPPVVPEPAARRRRVGRGQPHGGVGAAGGVAQDRSGQLVEPSAATRPRRGCRPSPGASPRRGRPPAPSAPAAPAAARPGRACCARTPSWGSSRPSRYSGSSARSFWLYMPPEVTSSTRGPSLSRRVGRSSSVISTGPEHVHGHRQLVALGRLGALGRHHAGVVHQHVEAVAASSGTRRRSAVRRPGRRRRTGAPRPPSTGWRRRSSRPPPWPWPRSRTTRWTRAPSRATPSAVARPSPEVAPVTATIAAGRASTGGSAGQPGNRDRTLSPIWEKPSTTLRSSSGVDAPRRSRGGGLRVQRAPQLRLGVVGELLQERRAAAARRGPRRP